MVFRSHPSASRMPEERQRTRTVRSIDAEKAAATISFQAAPAPFCSRKGARRSFSVVQAEIAAASRRIKEWKKEEEKGGLELEIGIGLGLRLALGLG